jgi:hypothetical protein
MNKWRVLPTCALLLLAACHGDSSQAPEPTLAAHSKKPAAVKRGPTPDELTAGMVEAVTIGKSTVPITVKFELHERPVVGRPLDVIIAVLPQVTGAATLQVTGSAGLQLAPGAETVKIPSIESAQAYRVTISTTPTADGVQGLGINVSVTHDDTTEARSFSVPVIVSASADTASVSNR